MSGFLRFSPSAAGANRPNSLRFSIRNFLLPHFIAHPEVGKDFFAVFPDASPDYVSVVYPPRRPSKRPVLEQRLAPDQLGAHG